MADRYVLDASALLCLLNGEPGCERVEEVLDRSVVATVNLSEVVAKIVERGGTVELAAAMLDPLHLRLIDFTREHAMQAGGLRGKTRERGLSLGDRACLAVTATEKATALTTDRAWAAIDVGLPIEILR